MGSSTSPTHKHCVYQVFVHLYTFLCILIVLWLRIRFGISLFSWSKDDHDADHYHCISDVFSSLCKRCPMMIWIHPSSCLLYFWSIWSLIMALISLSRCFQIHCCNITCIWQQALGHLFLSLISIWRRTAWSLPRSCKDAKACHVMTVFFSVWPLLMFCGDSSSSSSEVHRPKGKSTSDALLLSTFDSLQRE